MSRREFSLITGGPVYRFLGRIGFGRLGWQITAAAALTWVPLLILTLVHDATSKRDVIYTFLLDPRAYARFLLAVPLLIGIAPIVDRWTSRVLQHLTTSGLVSDSDAQEMGHLAGRLLRLRGSLAPELVTLALAYANTVIQVSIEKRVSPMPWIIADNGSRMSLNPAGWWLYLVSLPVFSYLVLLWVWRFGVWSYFLCKVSRFDLRLIPVHPDLAGGLEFLTISMRVFGGLSITLAAVIAAGIGQNIIFRGASAFDYQGTIVAYSLVAPAIILAPLTAFSRSLIPTRYWGQIRYSALADEYTTAFDDKWIERQKSDEDELLGTQDIQALADLAYSFEVIRKIRLFPFTIKDYVTLAVVTFLPFLPLILTVIPAKDIVVKLLRLLFQ